jgi:hypothetical protein
VLLKSQLELPNRSHVFFLALKLFLHELARLFVIRIDPCLNFSVVVPKAANCAFKRIKLCGLRLNDALKEELPVTIATNFTAQ